MSGRSLLRSLTMWGECMSARVAAAMSRCLEQFSRDIAERFGEMAR